MEIILVYLYVLIFMIIIMIKIYVASATRLVRNALLIVIQAVIPVL
jgi:hypothetical protein